MRSGRPHLAWRARCSRGRSTASELAARASRVRIVAALTVCHHVGTTVIPATTEDVVDGFGAVVERPISARVVSHSSEIDESLVFGDLGGVTAGGSDAEAERDETDEYDSSRISEHNCSS
jgi:hypothetical protein